MIDDPAEHAELCQELAATGFPVKSVFDLVNRQNDYEKAIPVLVRWLRKKTCDRVKEGVARALTLRDAPVEVAEAFWNEIWDYRPKTPYQGSIHWVMGNALSVMMKKEWLPRVIQFVSDPTHVDGSYMLIRSMGLLPGPDTVPTLLNLLQRSDTGTQACAMMALARLGTAEALEPLRAFLTNPDSRLVERAQKSIDQIERKLAKKKTAKRPRQPRQSSAAEPRKSRSPDHDKSGGPSPKL